MAFKENNFFSNNIQKYGEDFLDYVNARDIQIASINIFRAIARERINLDKYGHYFLNTQFLESCIQGAMSKYMLYSISYSGVNYMVSEKNMGNTETISVLDYHRKCTEAYTIILTELNNIKATKDIAHLYVMANSLKPYRNNI